MLKRVLIIILFFCLILPVFSQKTKKSNLNYAVNLQEAFAEVAEKALPAVVIVKTAKKIKQYYYLPPHRGYPYFRRKGQVLSEESAPIPSGQASGFVIHENGFVLTNYHVVENQSSFKIALFNGKEYDAKIIGVDPETDLAVLKIKIDEKLPYLKFADFDKVKVGHFTIAVGAPLGLTHTVTTGIVSFKGRSSNNSAFNNYIQTDAAINPGNSGGPLLNLHGEVIGVNNFIMAPPGSQGNVGLGFALSSQVARKTSQQLITKGKADKPWLGIGMVTVNIPEKISMQKGQGVLVTALYKDGPAEQGGIRYHDIITKCGNNQVNAPESIQKEMVNYLPGDIIDLQILRKGEIKVIKVKVGIRPNQTYLNLWRIK